MINVQATRKSTVETAPGREDYEEKQDRSRRFVPLIFLLIVGSCTAYLKSFLPTKLGASEDREKVRGSGGEENLKEDALAAAEEPAEEQPEPPRSSGWTEEGRIVARAEEERAVGGGATDFSARARTDKPELNNKGAGASPKVANDNHRPRQEDSGSGGGSGGVGGGDRPRDPPAPDHRNRAPRVSGAVHLPDVVACHGLAISMAALLAGATDADGDNLTVVGIFSSSGSLVRTEDGWEFDRAPNMLGEVKLTYAISDGSHIVMQTAYFNVVEAPPIVGTESDDILLGTQCAETIVGLGGDDNIDARGGNDRISGGVGDDHILAGTGHDVVYAGDGNDTVFAGTGNDVVFGGAGDDRLWGDEGDDTLLGEEGDDHLDGGAGRDVLLAGAGDDTLEGGDGHDHLDGGEGADRMSGGSGNDIIADGGGSDVVTGGAGNDIVMAAADAADDGFAGGAGVDTLDYSSATRSIGVDLGSGTASGTDIGNDAIAEFEIVIGGAGDDTLTAAGSASASINGGGGNDVVAGGAGDDTLTGGTGNDTISDGGGSDAVAGEAGNDLVLAVADATDDSLDGGAGTDTLDYSSAIGKIAVNLASGRASGEDIGEDAIAEFEIVVGGAGDDVITGSAGADTLAGGAGNDTIADGGGADKVDGGFGDDVVLASVDGADDAYDGNSGQDTLDYSATTVTVTIDLRSGTAMGREIGKDLIEGFEEIIAGSGDDVIIAGSGPVVLTGGAGDDCFQFERDDDGRKQQDVVKKITDFTVGDKIVAATYQITIKEGGDAEEQVADLFEQIYLEENDGGHNRPVRFRFEELANSKYTAIDVHYGNDDGDGMTIEVAGHHHLQFSSIHS